MSDQDFNFNPPPRRDAKKAFEPPPWEQDQFEELARRKEAEKAAVEVSLGSASGEALPVEPHEGPPLATPVGETAPLQTRGTQATAAAPGDDPDPRIETMLMGLRSEEPPFGRQLWKVALAAAVVLALVGAVLTVWGLFALAAARRTGALGALGGGILISFGLGFVAVGGWMVFRTLRQQGVL